MASKPARKERWSTADAESLFRAILALRNMKEAKGFFRDLLTESEISEFANRWKVAKMLSQNVPYTEIEKETSMSSTTIARIKKWLSRGEGGYRRMIARLGGD